MRGLILYLAVLFLLLWLAPDYWPYWLVIFIGYQAGKAVGWGEGLRDGEFINRQVWGEDWEGDAVRGRRMRESIWN